jgi:endonuclease/exonuclease/phosphatase family metal-dependent hydrolase
MGLIELKNSTRSYTWTNNQSKPIMAALDKIYCTTNFEQKFPLAFVTVKARVGSEHVPLVLNLGVSEAKNLAYLGLRNGGLSNQISKKW